MKKLLPALSLLLVPTTAFAQCNGQFPPGFICGNNQAFSAPPRAIPGSSVTGPGTSVVGDTAIWNNTTGTNLADLPPGALTKTDDTNVTLTLGGSPTNALLRAASITVGWTGTLSVARGGTGLASGTSGGIPFYSATNTIASSGLLTANGVLLGGGAGGAPTSTAVGTNGQLFFGVTAGPPQWATLSQDGTVTNAGVLTVTKTNNVSFGALATLTPGTGAATALAANVNASGGIPTPTPTRAGDVMIWTGSAWSTLAGNNSGTQFLQENASGVPSWATVAGTGTVTTVSTAGVVTGGPITTSGTINLNATFTPQVRATLVPGTPVMTTSNAAVNTVYVTPYAGNLIPIYDGSANMVPTAFAEVSQLTTDATKSPAAVVNNTNYDILCWVDTGPTNRCTRGWPWSSSTTRGTGAGTAQISLINGIWVNTVAVTNGPAANRGTVVASVRSNGSSLIDYIFGSAAAGGGASILNVFNFYNRVDVTSQVRDSNSSWNDTTASTWQAADPTAVSLPTTAIRVSFLRGLDEEGVTAIYTSLGSPGVSTIMTASVGLDSTSALPALSTTAPIFSTVVVGNSIYNGTPGLGSHFLSAIEWQNTTTSSTWFGTATGSQAQMGLSVRMKQ